MSLRETYQLAHTAQCKLRIAVDRPDRNLRFMVGHAMHLDSLMLRIVEIEDSIDKSQHSSAVKFKGTGVGGNDRSATNSRTVKKSPPPATADHDTESDEDEYPEDVDESEETGLSLTRFPSGAAAPPRHPESEPQLIPSDGDSDSDEDLEDILNRDPDSLREIINNNSSGDQFLAELYNDVKKCSCHKTDAPSVERMWELPEQKTGVRTMVAEVAA